MKLKLRLDGSTDGTCNDPEGNPPCPTPPEGAIRTPGWVTKAVSDLDCRNPNDFIKLRDWLGILLTWEGSQRDDIKRLRDALFACRKELESYRTISFRQVGLTSPSTEGGEVEWRLEDLSKERMRLLEVIKKNHREADERMNAYQSKAMAQHVTITELNTSLDKTVSELRDQIDQNDRQQEVIRDLNAQIDELKRHLQSNQDDFDDWVKTRASLIEDLRIAEQGRTDLKHQLDQAIEQRVALSDVCDRRAEEIVEANAMVDEMQKAAFILLAQLSDARNRVKDSAQAVANGYDDGYVQITVNSQPFSVPKGKASSDDIRSLASIALEDYILLVQADGEFLKITEHLIEGGEVFVSNPPSGGSAE